MHLVRIGTYTAIMFMFSACTALKFVPKDEVLYTGSKFEIVTGKELKGKRKVIADTKDVLRPKPNSQFLGMRPALWLYYKIGTPKKPKGVKNWLKTKLGQPPVY